MSVNVLQGSESAADGGASSTTVVDLEIKMEELRQALRKAQVFDWLVISIVSFMLFLHKTWHCISVYVDLSVKYEVV